MCAHSPETTCRNRPSPQPWYERGAPCAGTRAVCIRAGSPVYDAAVCVAPLIRENPIHVGYPAPCGKHYFYRTWCIYASLRLFPLCCILFLCIVAAACTGQQPQDPAYAPTNTSPVTESPAMNVSSGDGGAEPGSAATSSPWEADGIITDGEYAERLEVAPGYTVHWNNDAELLTMGLEAQVEGWVAIGFEPTSRMNDADMVLGWVEDGKATVQDQFSIGPTGPHPPDTDLGGSDDLLERGGNEQDGTTVIEFSRRLDTGDAYDNALSPGQRVNVIWALSSGDDPTPRHDVARGSAEITLVAA
jgi:hypothetical protein